MRVENFVEMLRERVATEPIVIISECHGYHYWFWFPYTDIATAADWWRSQDSMAWTNGTGLTTVSEFPGEVVCATQRSVAWDLADELYWSDQHPNGHILDLDDTYLQCGGNTVLDRVASEHAARLSNGVEEQPGRGRGRGCGKGSRPGLGRGHRRPVRIHPAHRPLPNPTPESPASSPPAGPPPPNLPPSPPPQDYVEVPHHRIHHRRHLHPFHRPHHPSPKHPLFPRLHYVKSASNSSTPIQPPNQISKFPTTESASPSQATLTTPANPTLSPPSSAAHSRRAAVTC